MPRTDPDRPLTDEQELALIHIADRADAGALHTSLYMLRDTGPMVDGRCLTSLVRKGLLERHAPEPPFDVPSYSITAAGRALLASMGD